MIDTLFTNKRLKIRSLCGGTHLYVAHVREHPETAAGHNRKIHCRVLLLSEKKKIMIKVSRINAGQVLVPLRVLLRNTTLSETESPGTNVQEIRLLCSEIRRLIKKTNERDDERFVSGVEKYF